LGNTNRPINQTDYNAALFWTYLTEKYGTQPVDSAEGGMNLMAEFWKASANKPNRDGIANLNDAIAALHPGPGPRFREIWKDFAVANYAKDLTGQPAKYKYADMAEAGGGANYNPPTFAVDMNLALNTPFIQPSQTVRQWGANYYRFKPANDVPFLDIKFTQDTNVPVYYTVIGVKGKDYQFEYNVEGRNLNRSFVNNGYSEVVVIVAGLESLANYRIAVNGTQPSLQILTPTTANSARVGSPGAPEKFRVAVQLLAADATPISGVDLNLFNFRIGGVDVPADHILTKAQIADQEWFVLRATTQSADGFYDFSVNYNHIATLDVTQTNAIDYVPRTSADNMLVIDHSTSMGEAGGAKINTAKDAARLYVDSWRSLDKLGVISFGNTPNTDMNLQDWSDSGANTRQTALDTIKNIALAGATNIGDSLMSAFNILTGGGDPTHDWGIILLSDGKEENTSPTVKFPDAITNIANATGKKPVIHAIAIGPDADGPLMQQAATSTGGTYQFVSAPDAVSAAGVAETHGIATTTGYNSPNSPTAISDPHLDLDARYRYIAADEVGHQQFYLTQGAVTLAEDSPQDVPIPVEGSVAELSLSLSFHNEGINNCTYCNTTLKDPNGTARTPTEAGDDLNDTIRTFVWRISSPAQGTWTLHFDYHLPGPKAADVHSPADTVSFLVQADVKSDVILDVDFPVPAKDRVSGVPMPIVATLTDVGPIQNATVIADIIGPAGTPYSIALLDDGQHGDGAAGDGVYANTFYNTLLGGTQSGGAGVGGSYNVTVTAFGNSVGAGGSFTRQKILGFFIYASGDDDGDGMPNEYEQIHGGGGDSTGQGGSSTSVDPNADPDHDGVSNVDEAQLGTDPNDADTDGGGEPDGSEIDNGRNPLSAGDDKHLDPTTIAAYPNVSKVYVRYAPQADYNTTQLYRSQELTGTYTLATGGEDQSNSGIFTDTNVTNDQLYCYYVVGITITGYKSDPSNVSCATPKSDPGAPEGGFLINGGAQKTTSRNVKLSIFASDQVSPEALGINKWDALIQPPSDSHTTVTKMAISNNAQMKGASFVAFAASADWTLAQSKGLAMVYMQFEDAAGNRSKIVPNGITVVSGGGNGNGDGKQKLQLPFVTNEKK
jgi:Mg-chelatase subunit ChlD